MTPSPDSRCARIPRRTSVSAILPLAIVAGLIGACSSSDATGPGDAPGPLAELAGRWEATSMVLGSVNDDSSVDIVQDERFSGAFVLTIQEDGRYTASLTVFGQEQVERGTLSLSGDTLIFDPDGDATSRVTWSRSGDRLTLDGESSFDFNGDGEDEEATLHLELVLS